MKDATITPKRYQCFYVSFVYTFVIRMRIHHGERGGALLLDFWTGDGSANDPSLFANHHNIQ